MSAPRGIIRPNPPTHVPGRDDPPPTPPPSDPPAGDDEPEEQEPPHGTGTLYGALRRSYMDRAAPVLAPFKSAARWFCRGIDPFLDVPSVFHYGIQSKGDANVIIEGFEVYTVEERQGIIDAYRKLLAQVPNYEQQISTLPPDVLQVLITISSEASKDSRSDDTSNCRKSAPTIANEDMKIALNPAILPSGPKVERGFNHDQLALMLAPVELVQKYRKESRLDELPQELRDGKHEIVAENYPAFLYEGNGVDYDDKVRDGGMMRGYFLVRIFKSMFLGATSATRAAPGKGLGKKKAIAEKYHIKQVTPRIIAYAAIQARHSISSLTTWGRFDGDFDYEAFYYAIIDDFEGVDADPKWSEETLAWWNHQVFGTSTTGRTQRDGASSGPSARELMLQQRRERRAAQEAQNATDGNGTATT